MARQKRTITGLIPGHATHTRTAETYMGALLTPPRGQGTPGGICDAGTERREKALAAKFSSYLTPT